MRQTGLLLAVLFVAVLPAVADQDRISGNWQLIATLPGMSPTYIGTTIARSNNSLSGVFHILDLNTPNCFPGGNNVIPALNLVFTGTVKRKHDRVTISSDQRWCAVCQPSHHDEFDAVAASQLVNGTFSVTGGCDDGDYGDVTGRFVPDLSGNWSGTFAGAAATAALTQAQVADSNGWFAITGTIDFSSPSFSPCFTSATVTSATSGGIIQLGLNPGDGSTITRVGIVQDAPIGKRLFLSGGLSGSHCTNGTFSGTLTRP